MTLTEKDLDEIEKLIEKAIKGKVKGLPSRDEFLTAMDKVVGELQTMREELAFTNRHLNKHENRITALEEIHPQGQHLAR